MKTLKTNEQIIEQIFSHFDFELIHSYMKINKWQYKGEYIPEIEELKDTAKYLIRAASLSDNEFYTCGTGGFFVLKGYGEIRLYFYIESWNAQLNSE